MRRLVLAIVLAALALAAWSLWPAGFTPRPATAALDAPRREDHPSATEASPAARRVPASANARWRANLPPECDRWDDRRTRTLLAALDPESSAEDALAHASLATLFEDGGGDPDARRRAEVRHQAEWQAARRRWPSDLDIAWQAARNCAPELDCDQEAAQRHLLALDPGNAAAWLLAMDGDLARGRHGQFDADLAQAAKTARYEPRTGSLFRALQPVLAAMPLPEQCLNPRFVARRAGALGRAPKPEDWANDDAAMLELAINKPPGNAAMQECTEHFGIPLPAQERRDCIAVLAMVANGATFDERETALALLVLLLGDSPDGIAARERYRRTLYLASIELPPPPFGTASMRIMETGEFEARRQDAVARHLWPPPDDWLPPWEMQRALVTRGRMIHPGIDR